LLLLYLQMPLFQSHIPHLKIEKIAILNGRAE
jgi:hypothetical protein